MNTLETVPAENSLEQRLQLLIEAVNFRVQERLVKAQRIYTSYADLGSWLQAYFEEMLAFASGPAFLNMVLYFNQKGLVQDEIRLHLCHNNDAYLERMARTIQHFYPQPIEQSRLHGIASMILFTVEGVAAHGALQQNRERFKSSWQWLIQVILRDLAAYERSSV